MFKSFRKESRIDWGIRGSTEPLSDEQLKLGAILRIADATEAMAKRHTELLEEVERLKRYQASLKGRIATLKKSNAGLRGYLRRMKEQRHGR